MSNWTVENRLTGEVVYAYGADQPDHFGDYPLEQFNHIKQKDAGQQQPQIPPQVQQAIEAASQQIEQLHAALQQSQQQLEAMASDKQAEQQKTALEGKKLKIEGYKAETERMQVQLEAMRQENEGKEDAEEAAMLQQILVRIEQIESVVFPVEAQPQDNELLGQF